MVETQKKLQKSSIEKYKILKNIHIKKIKTNELRKEIKNCKNKEKEVLFWKTEYNKKLSGSVNEKNKSLYFKNLLLK